jgi:hypothetical protein
MILQVALDADPEKICKASYGHMFKGVYAAETPEAALEMFLDSFDTLRNSRTRWRVIPLQGADLTVEPRQGWDIKPTPHPIEGVYNR